MSIDLTPRRRALGDFTMGTWSWGYLLELAGPVIPGFWNSRGRWYMVTGDRFHGHYPDVLGDSGRSFYVRAAEARQLANVARNWAEIQGLLPESARIEPGKDKWPEKVRDDWPPMFLAFADWAEKSGGFTKGV